MSRIITRWYGPEITRLRLGEVSASLTTEKGEEPRNMHVRAPRSAGTPRRSWAARPRPHPSTLRARAREGCAVAPPRSRPRRRPPGASPAPRQGSRRRAPRRAPPAARPRRRAAHSCMRRQSRPPLARRRAAPTCCVRTGRRARAAARAGVRTRQRRRLARGAQTARQTSCPPGTCRGRTCQSWAACPVRPSRRRSTPCSAAAVRAPARAAAAASPPGRG
mmetsp:Transcript_6488/g.20778  ORF Transcript_6488/g.20778 Transcript_6488/m.20778 type:complete len:220 (-) Transcript_6488:105-764(-)